MPIEMILKIFNNLSGTSPNVSEHTLALALEVGSLRPPTVANTQLFFSVLIGFEAVEPYQHL